MPENALLCKFGAPLEFKSVCSKYRTERLNMGGFVFPGGRSLMVSHYFQVVNDGKVKKVIWAPWSRVLHIDISKLQILRHG